MTDTKTPLDLASGFAPATIEKWRQLVDKALQGADFDRRLVTRTADGLRIEPLYTRADTLAESATSLPGGAPFTRGARAQGDDLGWQIHQRVTEADPAAANKVVLEEFGGGANGVVLQIAGPGQAGINIASAQDAATVLAGVYAEYAPVQLAPGLEGPRVARYFTEALAARSREPDGTAISRLNVDPIGALARFGTAWAPLDTALADTVKLAAETRKSEVRLTTILVDATIPHEAGASEGQELAFLAAALAGYLRAFEAAGVAPQVAFASMAFALSVDTDLFLNAAKMRAARKMIARIAEAAAASPAMMHITAVTSGRMMAKRDPWTNMLRTTAACAAAAFGGADAITVLPYTWALGAPDRFARRTARNTQLVLQEESMLGRVADPTGGSWYVEKLTDELANKGWALFQDIEKKGGIASVLGSGALQDDIALVVEARSKAIATGRIELTGVSVFPFLGDDGVKVVAQPAAASIGKTNVRPLTPHRLAEPFEALREASDAFLAKSGKRPRVFLANLGEIAEHNKQSTWVWNLLAAGGIEGLTSDGYKDATAAAEAFKASGASIACLCSSDEVYAREAEKAVNALKKAGAKRVLMAGRPREAEAALRAAGVDAFLFAGQDTIAVLKDLHSALKV